MTSQTDKLFQRKLENFQRPAPAAAWERIESNLDKTNRKAIWMKVAAAIVFLAVATFLLWPATSSTESQLTSTKSKRIEKTPVKIQEAEKVIPPAPSSVQDSNKETISHASPDTKKKTQKRIDAAEPIEKTTIQADKKNAAENIPLEITPSETVATTNAPAQTEVATSTVIVYTAEEVNAKYLRKKSTADATADEKKSSGMQKLIGLAYALKNNESGLSDLRQKKDEILALNFLHEDNNTKRKN